MAAYYVPYTEVNLHNSATVRKFHDHLEAARSKAQLMPLEPGLRFNLDLAIPLANPHPKARSLPLLPPISTGIPLRLDHTLQSGLDRFSQVWTAVVEASGSAENAIQTILVLKIVQPSMCPYPDIDDHWFGNYTFPEYIASDEALVYDQLAHKQGLSIPYFFGIHTIVTPSNETAWVLVLEHIPGQTLQVYVESANKTLKESCELLKLSVDTLMDFMSDGWYHLDLALRNILVAGQPGKREVVFIDLYAATTYDSDLSYLKESQRIRKRRLYDEIRETLKDDGDELERWAESNLESEVTRSALSEES